jgi:hypothetical protein
MPAGPQERTTVLSPNSLTVSSAASQRRCPSSFMGMIGTPDDDGLAFRSIVRDDGDDDDDRDDEDGDDDREHGGDIASRPSISAIRLPGSTNSSSSRLFSPLAPLPSLITTRAMASASGEHWPAGDVAGVIFGGWVGCGGSCQAPVCQMLHIGKMTMPPEARTLLVSGDACVCQCKHCRSKTYQSL